MTALIVGLILFLSVHSVSIVSVSWRDRTAARIGEGPWRALYSVIALVGFVLVIVGYGAARQDPVVVYVPPPWLRQVTLLLMVFVFPLLLATYLPGRIRATVKHPMLTAVKIWAIAHLLSNGFLADVLLFGSFLIWAGVDRISVKRRPRRAVPAAAHSRWNDAIALAGGLAIYAVFLLGGHTWLFGVPASSWTLF